MMSPFTAASPAAPAPEPVAARPTGLVAAALLVALRIYQRTLSPVLPVLTLGRCGCRFHPTCSHYAVGAIQAHGALRGLGLALVRLVKCTPLHPGGFDPVPPRRPRCQRVAPSAPAPHSPSPVS